MFYFTISQVHSDLHSSRMKSAWGKVQVDTAKFPSYIYNRLLVDASDGDLRYRKGSNIAIAHQISGGRAPCGEHLLLSIPKHLCSRQEVDTDLLTFLRGLALPACFWSWDIQTTTKPAWHGHVRCQALPPPFRQRLSDNGTQSMHIQRYFRRIYQTTFRRGRELSGSTR